MNVTSKMLTLPIPATTDQPSQPKLRAASEGSAQDASGSVMAFMIEFQRMLEKEAEEQMLRQEQQHQEQGYFQRIGNFLTGSDGGSGTPANRPVSKYTSDDWKFRKLP